MTSRRQLEANRRNAIKSTGPRTAAGKDRSRRNAVRHGLTAETVIGALEDAQDYKGFEAAVTADFNPETAVERELVLRLASLLWRLRRTTSIETGMFQTSGEMVGEREQAVEPPRETFPDMGAQAGKVRPAVPSEPNFGGPVIQHHRLAQCSNVGRTENSMEDTDTVSHLAVRFLHLAAVDKGAFERLGRYETALWRQVCQTVFMLEVLRRGPPAAGRRGHDGHRGITAAPCAAPHRT